MKKPYLDFQQRNAIKYDTLEGAMLKVHIEMKKIARSIDKWIENNLVILK